MKKNAFLNITVGITSLALGIIAVVSDEFRLPALIAAAMAILVVGVWGIFSDIDDLKSNHQKILEKLDIHQQLIDIKADIKTLKRGKT